MFFFNGLKRAKQAKQAEEVKETKDLPKSGNEVVISISWGEMAKSGDYGEVTQVIATGSTPGFYVKYENGNVVFHPMWHWIKFVTRLNG